MRICSLSKGIITVFVDTQDYIHGCMRTDITEDRSHWLPLWIYIPLYSIRLICVDSC